MYVCMGMQLRVTWDLRIALSLGSNSLDSLSHLTDFSARFFKAKFSHHDFTYKYTSLK